MKYKGMLSMLFMLSTQFILGQSTESKRANHWYFGENCGINFSSGMPSYVLDGQANALEGCSAISDASGDLIFYTDGRLVWNSSHTQMPNGFGLHGDWSSINAALIVPKPLDANVFYIFTTPANGGHMSGFESFEYSTVDMTLNDGQGDVAEKGVELFSIPTEQLGGIQHCNQQDYWVIAHQDSSSSFRTYLIDENGVDTTPVLSNVGIFVPPYSASCWSCYVADLDISPTGNKVAATYPNRDTLELFDFDNNTGLLSNPITINLPELFSACFSPDGTKLYVSHWSNSAYTLSQFDATASSASELMESETTIKNGILSSTMLQIGPDGKIYSTDGDNEYLSVINYPNLEGLDCSYNTNEVYLGGQRRYYGLPNFIQSYFSTDDTSTGCMNTSTEQITDISLAIYPNPLLTQTDLHIAGYDLKSATILIYSVDGKLKSQIEDVAQNIVHIADLGLENGCYILKIIDEGEWLHTSKLMLID